MLITTLLDDYTAYDASGLPHDAGIICLVDTMLKLEGHYCWVFQLSFVDNH